MFAKVQIDNYYYPDNADNAHQGIRKRPETGIQEYRDIVFQFPISVINCFWLGAINFVFAISPQKKVHRYDV